MHREYNWLEASGIHGGGTRRDHVGAGDLDTSITTLVRLARINRELLATPDEEATLRCVVSKAAEFVPGCESAAVIRKLHGKLRSAAWTDELARTCDERQVTTGEGPAPTAISCTEICVVDDLSHEARWPAWTEAAVALGARSALGLRLVVGADRLGALCLYSSRPHAFPQENVLMGFAFASNASVALFAARQTTGLSNAVDGRHLIGMAQGILMHRYRLNESNAFDLLRRYSNTSNVKLRDVAARVVQLRDLPHHHHVSAPTP